MPLWKNTQHSFAAGQLDTHVMGRQDMERYFKGATLLKNFVVKRQGCISKRRGTDLTADLDGLLGQTYAGVPITPDKMRLVSVTNGDEGRYVILTGGIGFVASRDGVLMANRSRARSIRPYTATDVDGRPVVVNGRDVRYSTETPVDVIHRVSAGNYTVTRYGDTLDGSGNVTSSALQNAFNAAVDGDTIRLHCNITIKTAVTVTRSNAWTTDGGASATVQWNDGTSGNTQKYKITTGGQSYYANETDGYGTRSRLTFARNGETVTVTEANKSVTLDLYGYKVTQMSNYGLVIQPASVSLTVDSSRVGAQFAILGPGNETILFWMSSRKTGVLTGSLHLKGDIDYDVLAGQNASMVVDADDATSIVIDAGNFETHSLSHYIVKLIGGPLVVNGGTFTNKVTGNGKVQLIYLGHNSGTAQGSSATINGGDFTNLNPYNGSSREHWAYVFCNYNGTVTLNGGRFTTASSENVVYKSDYRGHTFWANGLFRIVRGEFSTASIACSLDSGNEHALADYAEDGSVSNSAQPNANGFYGVKAADEEDYTYDGYSAFDTIPFRFAIPYADADLADLCIRQSGDTLFVAHRDYPPAKIWFNSQGYAFFEELELDNTNYLPPVIESASMVGNEPKETDWPSEFPKCSIVNNSAVWDVSGIPSWISDLDNVKVNGVEKTAVQHLKDFVNDCKNLGTVTDAGFSGNATSSASDGSGSYACSYSCTSVEVNHTTGRKTTTVSVLSFTKAITKEQTTTYSDGMATGSSTNTITTVSAATNSASATSVIVTRTVRYVATYVKDGRESRPSAPVAIDYDMPWANNAVVNITLGKGANADEPEYYNVYKDNGNGYGLIATVNIDRIAGGVTGAVDTYPLFMPDNTLATAGIVCAADFEEKKGWAVGDILRKMISVGKDSFTSSPANDICLVNTTSNTSGGIVIDFPDGTRFDRIRILLDGRIYDRESDRSYIIVSTNRVTCTVTYLKTDGTTGIVADTQTTAKSHSFNGIAGGIFIGVYEDWLHLPKRAFTVPNGDTVYGWAYGEGDCADDFNSHIRSMDFDFRYVFSAIEGFARVKSVKFTFAESIYQYWSNNQQGCIHAIHFYSGGTADAGIVQDDYINPDMTVTPPADAQDAHFSAADEYPGCVGIYEQRLVFASTRSSPSTIWMSRIADLYNFTAHESIREDDALELTLAATEFPNINHLVMGRDLMLFGDGGEWLVSPVTGNALTYKTASAKLQSMVGSDRKLQPLQLADETLFAERGGTCLRSINYSYTSDSYQSQDLSVIAQSIFRANPIVSMAYKQHPDSIVECVLADGRVATLVYMKEQDVAAWSVQELGGGWKAKEIVTPKCIVDGTTEMMLLVEKDGVYQLWKVRNDDDARVAASQVVLDALHVSATDAAGAGEVSVALGNGTYAVGYPVVSELVTVRPEPEKGQTAQMEIKNATEAEVRVIDATTFSVKPYAINAGWRDVKLPAVRSGTDVTLAEKDCKKLMTGTNNRDGRVHLKHAEPWPITVLSVSTTYQVEYENGGNEQ